MTTIQNTQTTEQKRIMANKNSRQNLSIRKWVKNALTNLAAKKEMDVPEYINDVLKLHVIAQDCDDFGNLPGMPEYQGSIKTKNGLNITNSPPQDQ